MKKTILILSLISSLGFAKGFVVKTGLEYGRIDDNIKKITTYETDEKVVKDIAYGKIGLEYGLEVYRKGKLGFELVPGAELIIGGNNAITKKEEKIKEVKRQEVVPYIMEQEDDEEDTPAQPISQPKYRLEKAIFEVSALASLSPQVTYDINDNTKLRAGVKLGVGVNRIQITSKKIYENNQTAPEITKVFATQVTIPYTLVLGLDHKHFSTNLEIGGKFNKGKVDKQQKYHNVNYFILGLDMGYKF